MEEVRTGCVITNPQPKGHSMQIVYWFFLGITFTALGVWFMRRCWWVRDLRQRQVGDYDLFDLWLEVLVNGKP